MAEKVKLDNEYEGEVRTDMYCHDCGKNFLATIDFSIEGNHTIVCPHCGHEHLRKIENGKITSDRWGSSSGSTTARTQKIWSDSRLKMQTSSASEFLRERWLNRSQ